MVATEHPGVLGIGYDVAIPSRRPPLAVAGVLGAATAAVALWNPGDDGIPLCPSRIVFGVDCPLCGATRAAAALARGHVVRAFDHNLMFGLAAPVVVAALVAWLVQAWRGRPVPGWARGRAPRSVWIGIAVAAVAFGLTRNLDAWAFTRWLGSDSFVG